LWIKIDANFGGADLTPILLAAFALLLVKTQNRTTNCPTVPKGSNNKKVHYQCHDQHIQVLYLYQHFQLDVIVWY